MKKPLVGVVMGSNSDWKVMQHAVDVLKDFGVPYETKVVSAHRTPDTLYRYAESAVPRGLRCVIAGAGGAAHLPVMFAAKTTLPVLCVPVTTRALHGIDSLLSIVQIPKGVPVKSERRRFSRSRASATTARARRWCALHAKRWRRGNPCGANRVIEKRVALDTEVSVVLARGIDNAVAIYPVSENTHAHGILDLSVVPVRISAPRACAAQAAGRRIAERLDNVGALAVEFFIASGKLMVNEIAPRPHNSGHYTLDACVTSQFEQQVRALCGLPLGDTRPLSPVAMVNLPGDLWANGAPRWERMLGSPRTKLHLYGKQEARPGHKMGHYTCLASTPAKARSEALVLRRSLVCRPAKRK